MILLVFTSKLFSQEWTTLLPDKDEIELTLYDYQNAFNKYWTPFHVENGYYFDNKGKRRKAVGWKQFKRWEYYWEERIDKESGKFPVLDSRNILNHYLTNNKIISRDANWTQRGPDSCEQVSYGEGEDYTVDFKDKFTWDGNTSTDWFDATNWDVGKIPSLNYEVIIPNTSNQPNIGQGLSANAKKITAESGAGLIINGILNLIE